MTKLKSDYIQGFLIEDWHVRGHIVRLSNTLQSIMLQHAYPKSLGQFLGDVLTATCLMTSTIKFEGDLTLQMQSDGVLDMLVAKCNHLFHLRGLARWDVSALPNELNTAIGEGQVLVTISQQDSAKNYQSIIDIVDGSIAKSLQNYFLRSEQIPSLIWLKSQEDEAYGVLVQALPNDQQQENWQHAKSLWEKFDINELAQQSNEALFKDLSEIVDVRVFAEKPVKFQCHCNEERMEKALQTVGYDEINDILEEKQTVVLTCEYCSREFSYNREQVQLFFDQLK